MAEALEPTITIIGAVPVPLLRHALDLAVATECSLLRLAANSGSGQLLLGCSDRATATLTLDLSVRSRAVLAFEQQIAIDAAQRLTAGLVREVPPDCQTIDIEVGDASLTLCAWDGDQVVWYDGAVLVQGMAEVADG